LFEDPVGAHVPIDLVELQQVDAIRSEAGADCRQCCAKLLCSRGHSIWSRQEPFAAGHRHRPVCRESCHSPARSGCLTADSQDTWKSSAEASESKRSSNEPTDGLWDLLYPKICRPSSVGREVADCDGSIAGNETAHHARREVSSWPGMVRPAHPPQADSCPGDTNAVRLR